MGEGVKTGLLAETGRAWFLSRYVGMHSSFNPRDISYFTALLVLNMNVRYDF